MKKVITLLITIMIMAILTSCGLYGGILPKGEPKEGSSGEKEPIPLTNREQELADLAGFPKDEKELSSYERLVISQAIEQWDYLDEKYGVEHKPVYEKPDTYNKVDEFLFHREDEPEILIGVWHDNGVQDDYLDSKLDYVMSKYITEEFLDKKYPDLEYKACRARAPNDDDNFDIDHLLGKEEGIGLVYLFFSFSEVSEARTDVIVHHLLEWIEENTEWKDFYFRIHLESDLFFELNDIGTIWPREIYDIIHVTNRDCLYIKTIISKDGEVTIDYKKR